MKPVVAWAILEDQRGARCVKPLVLGASMELVPAESLKDFQGILEPGELPDLENPVDAEAPETEHLPK